MMTARLSMHLCPDLVCRIVDLATTVDADAIADVHARYLERLVALEVTMKDASIWPRT